MNKKFLLKTWLLLALMVLGVSSAWADDYTTVATFKSADVVTNSGYQEYSDDDWSISVGGNNVSVGFNKTASNAKTIGDALGTLASSDYYGAVIKSKNKIDKVSQITFTYNGGSGNTGKIYLAYSENGTTWSAITLTEGIQGSSATTNMTFTFAEIESAYYGIILEKGKDTGVFRWDNVVIKFNKKLVTYALSFSNPVGGSIVVTKDGAPVSSGDTFEAETILDIEAVNDAHYAFSSWGSTAGTINSSTSARTTFTMPASNVTLSATFTAEIVTSNIVIDDRIENGTITADKVTANFGDVVTLTAVPNDGFALKSWTVLDGNLDEVIVTPIGENKATFIMPASDVIASATFAAKHTVTVNVAGAETSVIRVDGAELNLDSPETIDGMTFAGWSSTNNASSPSFIDNTTIVDNDMVVYAVFIAQTGSVTYNLIESNQTDWRGKYLIAFSSTIFADGRVGGKDTNTGGIGEQNIKQNPENNLNGNIVKGSWGDSYCVELEAIDDTDLTKGYLLKTLDGKYNYQTSNANGLAATTVKNTAAAYPISVTFTSSSDVKLALGGNAKGAVFRYNESGYFRFYKDASQKAVYLYKRTSGNPIYSLGTKETLIVTDAGYATYCTPCALHITGEEEVTAYKATIADDVVTFDKVTGFVPAGTGLLLKKENGGSCDIYTVGSGESLESNALVGVTETYDEPQALESGYSYYVLRNQNNNVGFYKITASSYQFKKGTAYLKVKVAGSNAKTFIGLDGTETAVEAVAAQEQFAGELYNLQGQRVDNDYKGIVIVNGKKVIR